MIDWLYWDVTHHLHTFCNPISPAAVDELGGLLELSPDTRVLDIACGHGEMMALWAEKYGCSGVGVDLSPYVLERARKRTDRIEFVECDGAEYRPDERFDVVLCIGASWIWNGFEGTLRAMKELAKPGAVIVSGEPYWYTQKPAEVPADEEGFFTLPECHAVAEKLDLATLWMRGSTQDEWDRYEMLQGIAVDRWARSNPDHPKLAEIRAQRDKYQADYIHRSRAAFGFAIWIFRT